MNFKYKNFLQKIFSKLPKGEIVNFMFQKYVTRALPVSNDAFLEKIRHANNHFLKFNEHNSLNKNSYKYYEFGAGWDLITPIAMGLLGFEVTCIDIRRLIFNHLIADTIRKFNNNIEQLPFNFNHIDLENNQNPLDYLKQKYNLNYVAPLDARNTKFSSNSYDFVSSTSTLEHIHEQDIIPILNETYRILKPGAILSMIIDYQDHWSYFDKSISIYNFLKYSDLEWEKFNPSLHFQNRLRHKDYLNIISKTNFKIMEDIPIPASDTEIKTLENLKLNTKYTNYSIDELSIKCSHIILKK